MRISSIYNVNSSQQQQKLKTQKVNFGFNPKSVAPEELRWKDGIIRTNMFGLKREHIDFVKGTKKLESYYRRYLAKRGNSERSSRVTISNDGTKQLKKNFYDPKFCYGEMEVENRMRNYAGKKLTSKIREHHGKDKDGSYLKKIETIYHSDGTTVAESRQLKWYKYVDEDDCIRYREPIKITTYFNESGIRTSEKRPTSYGSELRKFDQKGEKVINTTPVSIGDRDISYYGQYGYYTPKTGLQTY